VIEEPIDAGFEAAADAIHAGDLAALRALLDERPELISMRSSRAHRATLLHYVAANGIEAARQQQSPPNAVEVMRELLDRGAEPDATCETYGGGSAQTTLYLLVSSVHPYRAGVQAPLVDELCRGGARPNGLEDDGVPLWTAVAFGYTGAAEALVRCGARVDHFVLGAALGDAGSERLPAPAVEVAGLRYTAEHMLEYAVIYAVLHRRDEVLERLLARGPDLTVTEPLFGGTAAGMARYLGRDELAERLAQASR
jgi:hypothetical protein